MIKVNYVKTEIVGETSIVLAEATLALKKVSQLVGESLGIPEKEIMKKIYKTAKEWNEEQK